MLTGRSPDTLTDGLASLLVSAEPAPLPDCPDIEVWLALARGELASRDARRVRDHLATGCAACAATLRHAAEAVRWAAQVVQRRPLPGSLVVPDAGRMARNELRPVLRAAAMGGPLGAWGAAPALALGPPAGRPATTPFVATALRDAPASVSWRGDASAAPWSLVLEGPSGATLWEGAAEPYGTPLPALELVPRERYTWRLYGSDQRRAARGCFWLLDEVERRELDDRLASIDDETALLGRIGAALLLAEHRLYQDAIRALAVDVASCDERRSALACRALAAVYLDAREFVEGPAVGWALPEGAWLGGLAVRALARGDGNCASRDAGA